MTKIYLVMNRRQALSAALATATSAMTPAIAVAKLASALHFPANFRWGAATAAHQIEGNNINSDLWLMENLPHSSFKNRSADACDNYHRWREDIALLNLAQLSIGIGHDHASTTMR